MNKKVSEIKKVLNAELALAKAEKDKTKSAKMSTDAIAKANKAISEQIKYKIEERDMLRLGLEQMNATEKAQGSLNIQQESARKEQKRLIAQRNEHIRLLKDERSQLGDVTDAVKEEIKATKESTTGIKEKTKELLGLTEAQKEFLRSLDVDQEIAINALEFNIEDAEAQTDAGSIE